MTIRHQGQQYRPRMAFLPERLHSPRTPVVHRMNLDCPHFFPWLTSPNLCCHFSGSILPPTLGDYYSHFSGVDHEDLLRPMPFKGYPFFPRGSHSRLWSSFRPRKVNQFH